MYVCCPSLYLVVRTLFEVFHSLPVAVSSLCVILLQSGALKRLRLLVYVNARAFESS